MISDRSASTGLVARTVAQRPNVPAFTVQGWPASVISKSLGRLHRLHAEPRVALLHRGFDQVSVAVAQTFGVLAQVAVLLSTKKPSCSATISMLPSTDWPWARSRTSTDCLCAADRDQRTNGMRRPVRRQAPLSARSTRLERPLAPGRQRFARRRPILDRSAGGRRPRVVQRAVGAIDRAIRNHRRRPALHGEGGNVRPLRDGARYQSRARRSIAVP